jgi:hypothetical protein
MVFYMAKDVPDTSGGILTPVQRFKAMKANLLEWAQNSVREYPVQVTNLGSSFADGRAMMAIINACAPHILDFYPRVWWPYFFDQFIMVVQQNPLDTIQTVLNTAESELNVAPLFEPIDLARSASDKVGHTPTFIWGTFYVIPTFHSADCCSVYGRPSCCTFID